MQKISVYGLKKAYKNQVVLQDISFQVQEGDVLVLLGSSGAGKSTLLHCLGLLEEADEGIVKIDHTAIGYGLQQGSRIERAEALRQCRRKIGIVFQQFHLWPHMTVLENLIEAPLYVLKQDKKEAISRAQALLESMGLHHKQAVYPARLSGGEQQRVAIARALMMEPDIMLFDEPTSALDPEKVAELLQILRSLVQKGMTMVIASHEIGFARAIATQVAFMEAGAIVEQGPREILFHPSSLRFSAFLRAVQYDYSPIVPIAS